MASSTYFHLPGTAYMIYMFSCRIISKYACPCRSRDEVAVADCLARLGRPKIFGSHHHHCSKELTLKNSSEDIDRIGEGSQIYFLKSSFESKPTQRAGIQARVFTFSKFDSLKNVAKQCQSSTRDSFVHVIQDLCRLSPLSTLSVINAR